MSTPIPPTQGTTATGSAQNAGGPEQTAGAPPQSADGARRASARLVTASSNGPAASLDTFPSSPPREVLDEMASAARVHDALRAHGRELHFAHDGQSGRMTIEVRDAAGRVLRTISPSEALDVAAGKPLE